MHLGSPIEALSAALYHAAHLALPDVHYMDRDWETWGKLSPEERAQMMRESSEQCLTVKKVRRPDVSEVVVQAMFAQTWGSTSLGFGGMGGSAMTQAYTVVLAGPGNVLAVYWDGKPAYLIEWNNITQAQRDAFSTDLERSWTANLNDAPKSYGAINLRKSSQQAKEEKQKRKGGARATGLSKSTS